MTATPRWTATEANDWYAKQPWLVGANYVPAHASNQIEMWQAETFNPKQIESELALAKGLGMNTMRVFLHDLVWEKDPEGYKARIEEFLTIADRQGIKPLFVLFDSVWNPAPALGAQPEPKAGVHNAGWVQGPGAAVINDVAPHRARLQDYVTGVVSAFGNDKRVLGWDVWNEPDNTNGASYGAQEPQDKIEKVALLLQDVFQWARAAKPAQPLTSGVWIGEWDDATKLNVVQKVQLAESDFISFHNYAPADDFERRVKYLALHNRPLMCTEYMARPLGSTFEAILPVAKAHNVSMMNWGFVQGRTQTHLPWDSWQKPYEAEPKQWFHEIFRADHTPYDAAEAAFIRDTIAGAKAAPAAAAKSTPPKP